jgi:hypothetical protein
MLFTSSSYVSRVCSGRDLNPGSATRKAAMLDRIVHWLSQSPISTPPEHVGLDLRLPIKSFLGYETNVKERRCGYGKSYWIDKLAL